MRMTREENTIYKRQRRKRPQWAAYLKSYNQRPEVKERKHRQHRAYILNGYVPQTYHLKHDYWYCGNRRLARLIYQRYVGPIPKGWVVHHIDGNRQRNCLSNMQIMPNAEHTRLHKLGLI